MEASFLPLCPRPRVRKGQVPSATLHCLRRGLSLPVTGGHGFQAKLHLSPGPTRRPHSHCLLEAGRGWRQVLSPVGLPFCPSGQAHPLASLLPW